MNYHVTHRILTEEAMPEQVHREAVPDVTSQSTKVRDLHSSQFSTLPLLMCFFDVLALALLSHKVTAAT